MKLYLRLTGVIALLFHFLLFLEGQTPSYPTLPLVQGELIGALPYGRSFAIEGSARLSDGDLAQTIQLRVWDTGRRPWLAKPRLKELPPGNRESIMAARPFYTTRWTAQTGEDSLHFRLYVDRPLPLAAECLLEVSAFGETSIQLAPEQVRTVLEVARQQVATVFFRDRRIEADTLQLLLDRSLSAAFGPIPEVGQSPPYEWVLPEEVFAELLRQFDLYSRNFELIDGLDQQIANVDQKLQSLSPDSDEFEDVSETLATFRHQRQNAQDRLDQHPALFNSLLSATEQYLLDGQARFLLPMAVLVEPTHWAAVPIGTAVGGGLVGLSSPEIGSWDYDGFGYAAAKLYLLPVDKRLPRPYLEGRPVVNRLSLLFGFSFNGKLTYQNTSFNRSIGFYPLLGLGFDLTRQFSIDLGATVYEYVPDGNPAADAAFRVGPVFGLSFDLDLFNHIRVWSKKEDFRLP